MQAGALVRCYCPVSQAVLRGRSVSRRREVVLTFLGTFLLVVAVLAQTYATAQLKRIGTDDGTTTRLAGDATLSGRRVDIEVRTVTSTDPSRSTEDVVAWSSFVCVVEALPNLPDCVSSDNVRDALIFASIDDFATDRQTALAVNDPKRVPADALPHEGLVNRFPFDADKKSYPWWDRTAGRAYDAEYVDAVETDGLDTYHYRVEISDVPAEALDGVDTIYASTIDLYVEPTTGQIVDQARKQTHVLSDGTPVLELEYAATDAQVEASVEQARSDVSKLRLVHVVVPIIGYAAGSLLLLLAIASGVVSRRRREPTPDQGPRSERLVSG